MSPACRTGHHTPTCTGHYQKTRTRKQTTRYQCDCHGTTPTQAHPDQ